MSKESKEVHGGFFPILPFSDRCFEAIRPSTPSQREGGYVIEIWVVRRAFARLTTQILDLSARGEVGKGFTR
jgi:hypothetical protein